MTRFGSRGPNSTGQLPLPPKGDALNANELLDKYPGQGLGLPGGWADEFASYALEWAEAGVDVPPADWAQEFDVAARAHDALVDAGQWLAGPRTLLGVLGLRHLETPHSKVLAWLLDPGSRHGLGTRLLERLVARVRPDLTPADLRRARVNVEEPCQTDDACFGRADVVVRGNGWTIVIENKIWAGQHGSQLDVYFDAYTATEAQPTFVFLTPYGAAPRSQRPEVRAAFTPLSWARDIVGMLDDVLASSVHTAPTTAAASDYLEALREELH